MLLKSHFTTRTTYASFRFHLMLRNSVFSLQRYFTFFLSQPSFSFKATFLQIFPKLNSSMGVVGHSIRIVEEQGKLYKRTLSTYSLLGSLPKNLLEQTFQSCHFPCTCSIIAVWVWLNMSANMAAFLLCVKTIQMRLSTFRSSVACMLVNILES